MLLCGELEFPLCRNFLFIFLSRIMGAGLCTQLHPLVEQTNANAQHRSTEMQSQKQHGVISMDENYQSFSNFIHVLEASGIPSYAVTCWHWFLSAASLILYLCCLSWCFVLDSSSICSFQGNPVQGWEGKCRFHLGRGNLSPLWLSTMPCQSSTKKICFFIST